MVAVTVTTWGHCCWAGLHCARPTACCRFRYRLLAQPAGASARGPEHAARQALQGSYALGEFVAQSANLALVLSGAIAATPRWSAQACVMCWWASPRRPDCGLRGRTRCGAVCACDGRGHFGRWPQRVRLVRGRRPGPRRCRTGAGGIRRRRFRQRCLGVAAGCTGSPLVLNPSLYWIPNP